MAKTEKSKMPTDAQAKKVDLAEMIDDFINTASKQRFSRNGALQQVKQMLSNERQGIIEHQKLIDANIKRIDDAAAEAKKAKKQ